MKVIQTRAEIGEDRKLQVQLPADAPMGEVEVLVVVDEAQDTRRRGTSDERRAAAEAGFGALRGVGGTVEEFLAERRADETRREKALGL
jgi:hypothetical protein